jgi:hypothetical protein
MDIKGRKMSKLAVLRKMFADMYGYLFAGMFDDLFDFGKHRTLKQSVGFYIFYVGLFLSVSSVLNAFGV